MMVWIVWMRLRGDRTHRVSLLVVPGAPLVSPFHRALLGTVSPLSSLSPF
jgi:hypothetical protein